MRLRFLPFARPAGRPESVSGGTASPAAGALRSARSTTEVPAASVVSAFPPATRADHRTTAQRVDDLLHQLVDAPRV